MVRWVIIIGLVVSLAACDGGTGIRGSRGILGKDKKKSSQSGAENDGQTKRKVNPDGSIPLEPGKVAVEAAPGGFQVKSVELLKASVDSCFGKGLTVISADMLLPPISGESTQLSSGKIRFLEPFRYIPGQDIIDAEKGNLVDFADGARTSTSADGLSDTYLRSLEVVANVVAHNCTPAHTRCNCSTPEEAKAMIARCMPWLDPVSSEILSAANDLASVCSLSEVNGVSGFRVGISSLISSYGFARSR